MRANSTGDVTIRAATLADAPRIHELHLASVRAVCASCYEPAIIDGWLAGRSPQGYFHGISTGATFVAEAGGEIVGFCESVPGEVRAVFVDPRWKGKGFGAKLLSWALSLAEAGPSGSVRLESTLNAVSFYERFGFRPIAHTTVRRNDVEVPVVLMQKLNGREHR